MIIAKIKKWLVIAGAVVAAVTLALFTGRRQGRKTEQQQQVAKGAKAQQKGVEARNDAKNEVNKLPDGGAADKLRDDWMRND